MIKGSLPHSLYILRESDVMASTWILEEDLIQAVFDGLSDEDESAFLGATMIPRADLIAAG